MKTNYQSMKRRIEKAQTKEDIRKLEKSMHRLWYVDAFTVHQFGVLDLYCMLRLNAIQSDGTPE